MVQIDRIIRAIKSTVPQELWGEILRKIDGPVAADTPTDEFEDWDQGTASMTRGTRPKRACELGVLY